MPGFILHLTAAKMALERLDSSVNRNDFLFGNLAPDVFKEKTASHFRNPSRYGERIEYPDLDLFVEKYGDLLHDSSCLGYYFHLYIDRCFFKEYLPRIVTFLDQDEHVASKMDLVVWAKVAKTGEMIPVQKFFSEEYYYGDFTLMNRYLVERYQISFAIDTDVKNPGIEEVDYALVAGLLEKLEGWLDVPSEAVCDLKVFDVEDLIGFLENAVAKWFDMWITDVEICRIVSKTVQM